MRITESRLRKIIHDEIHEMNCRKLYKNYTFINELGTSDRQYDSYAKGIINDLPSGSELKLREMIRSRLLSETEYDYKGYPLDYSSVNGYYPLYQPPEARKKDSPIIGDSLPPDHWAQYVNLLNPIDAYENYTHKKAIADASKEIATKIAEIPVIGTPGLIAGAIFDVIDGNYQAASIKLIKAIIDIVVVYHLSGFIVKHLTSTYLAMGMTSRVGVATIKASVFVEVVIDKITTKISEVITYMLNKDLINQELYDAVNANLTPAVMGPIIAAKTESLLQEQNP